MSLPPIRLLDAPALTSLLAANLAPPHICAAMLFARNGSIFAHAADGDEITDTDGQDDDEEEEEEEEEEEDDDDDHQSSHQQQGDNTTAPTVLPQSQRTGPAYDHPASGHPHQPSTSFSPNDPAAADPPAQIPAVLPDELIPDEHFPMPVPAHISTVSPRRLRSLAATYGAAFAATAAGAQGQHGPGMGSSDYSYGHSHEHWRGPGYGYGYGTWHKRNPSYSSFSYDGDYKYDASASASCKQGREQKQLHEPEHDGASSAGSGADADAADAAALAFDAPGRETAVVRPVAAGVLLAVIGPGRNQVGETEGDEDSGADGASGVKATGDSHSMGCSPETRLALESKAAALGRFLAGRLRGLEIPADF